MPPKKKRKIESYGHAGKDRANNPPVGLVNPTTDPGKGAQSLPFERGKNSRIAVKIVDDRGIESLKVVVVVEMEIK